MVEVTIEENECAVITLCHGKDNALNGRVIEELMSAFAWLRDDPKIRVGVLTGKGSFFSFGFNIPELLEYSREALTSFLDQFTSLYSQIFTFPKPLIAAINGHCLASSTTLVSACDYRIMVAGKNRIGNNELGFGSTVFAGTVEILKHCVGSKNAEKILNSASLFPANEALALGLIDKMTTSLDIRQETLDCAREFANKDSIAYASIKRLMRNPVHEAFSKRESHSIHEFVAIWFSDLTRQKLQDIKTLPYSSVTK